MDHQRRVIRPAYGRKILKIRSCCRRRDPVDHGGGEGNMCFNPFRKPVTRASAVTLAGKLSYKLAQHRAVCRQVVATQNCEGWYACLTAAGQR